MRYENRVAYDGLKSVPVSTFCIMAKILDGFQESMVKLYRDQHANKFVPLRPQVAQTRVCQ